MIEKFMNRFQSFSYKGRVNWIPNITYFFLHVDDSSKLRQLEVEFLNDPANANLFEELVKPNEEPKPRKRKIPAKKAEEKQAEKAPKQRKKKKEPELVCTAVFCMF